MVVAIVTIKKMGAVRMVVEVVFSNDRVAKIEVREGDEPRRLAAEFLARFGLSSEYVPMLTAQIEASLSDDASRRRRGPAACHPRRKLSAAEQKKARERLYKARQPPVPSEEQQPAGAAARKSKSKKSQDASVERLLREGTEASRRLAVTKSTVELRELEELKPGPTISEESRKLARLRRGGYRDGLRHRRAAVQEEPDEWTCPKCGYSNSGKASFCERAAKFSKPLSATCPTAWAVSRRLQGATACGEPRPVKEYEPTIVSAKSRELIERWRGEDREWCRRRHPTARAPEKPSFKPSINKTSEAIIRERKLAAMLRQILDEGDDDLDDDATEEAARAAYEAALSAVDACDGGGGAVYDRLYSEACRRVVAEEPAKERIDAARQRETTDRLHGDAEKRKLRVESARRAVAADDAVRRRAAVAARRARPGPILLEDVHEALHREGTARRARMNRRAADVDKRARIDSAVKLGAASKRILAEKRKRAFEEIFRELAHLCRPSLEDLADDALDAAAAFELCDDLESRPPGLREAAKNALRGKIRIGLPDFLDAMNSQLEAARLAEATTPGGSASTDPGENDEPLPSFTPTLIAAPPDLEVAVQTSRKGKKIEDLLRSYATTYKARKADLAETLRADADKELTFRPTITKKAAAVSDYPLSRKFRDMDDAGSDALETPRRDSPAPQRQPRPPSDRDDDTDFSGDDASTLQIYAAAYHGAL